MPTDWFDKLARVTQSAGTRLTVRSALNPLLWLCAIFCPPCWAAAYLLRADPFVLRFLAGVSVIPVLTACGVGIYFAISKPERLQSEQFQLRQRMLEYLHEKGGRLTIDRELLSDVMNPDDRVPTRAPRPEDQR